MLRNHLIWRRANAVDNLLKTFDPSGDVVNCNKEDPTLSPLEKQHERMKFALKYLPIKRMGFDKDGCPVIYYSFGDMDAKGLLKCSKKTVAVNAMVSSFEADVTVMKKQSVKLGKPIEQWSYIVNFENYTFAKATHKQTLEALISLFSVYEANYPERLKAAFVINASVYFSLMFAVIKPLLSGATVSKIAIYGKDGWKEDILKMIHKEDLPAFLGGTRTDPDGNPLCNTIVNHGTLVPEELYLAGSKKRRISTFTELSKLIVARMSKVSLNLEVEEPGSLIQWEFETDGKDIGFQLLHKDSDCDDSATEIIPLHKVETHPISEVGAYRCEFPGTYTMVFDNTYSWMQQKNVYYRAYVVNPKVQKAAY